MRAIPLLTAALVVAGLYFWIVASGDANGAAQQAERAAADAAAATTGAAADGAGADGAGAGGAAAGSLAPVGVVTILSQAQDVENAVFLRGRTEAHRRVTLRAETDGLVTGDPLRAGAEVARGDLLCRLEMGSREAELQQARAALRQADADNRAAQTLRDRGYTAETTAIAREAALQAAAAAVRKVELDIQRLEISAPFDGVLETDAAEIGSLMRVGDECATVIALDPLEIVGFVPETDVEKLHVGGLAVARLISGQEIRGEITFISRAADASTRTFRVEVTADNPDGAVRDGMTAEIVIPIDSSRGHKVPQAALTLDDEGRMGVRTVVDDRVRFVPADILREEEDGVWLAGLPEEVEVIVVGQEYVADGRAVRAVRQER